jgi:hypothetical protein
MAMAVSADHTIALSVSADHLIGKYDLTVSLPIVVVAIKLRREQTGAGSVHRTKHPGNACISIRNDGKVFAVGGWDGR